MIEQVVESVTARPAGSLQPFVDRYIGYRLQGFEPGIHRGLPSAHLTFIISFDDPVDIAAFPDPAAAPAKMSAFVGGLHASPATIRHDGNQHGVVVQLTPLGARAVLGLPAGALASTVVALPELLGRSAVELHDRLEGAGGWPARFAVLDEVLTRAMRDRAFLPPEVTRAWEVLVAAHGNVEVGALAEEVGWSRRHLAERFRVELGLSPKVASRVLRFDRARRLLESPSRPSLADVAVACGYFDRAHLNRDWRQMAGCSPTVWMAEELPSVQDADPGEPAS